jgi:hypothetical protein
MRPGRKTNSADTVASRARRGAEKRGLSPVSAAVEAVRLLGKWQRLSSGHVMLSSGCSCGTDAGALPVQSFERDILDFLYARHGEQNFETLSALLIATARQPDEAAEGRRLALLADLERSIDSFDELHR